MIGSNWKSIFKLGYDYYKRHYKNPVKQKEYNKILDEYLGFVVHYLLEKGSWQFPARLGSLIIYGRLPKKRTSTGSIKRYINWKETNKLWAEDPEAKAERRKIYFYNEHTNGYVYTIAWDNRNKLISQKEYYKFVPNRDLKRGLAKRLLENSSEYIIMQNGIY